MVRVSSAGIYSRRAWVLEGRSSPQRGGMTTAVGESSPF